MSAQPSPQSGRPIDQWDDPADLSRLGLRPKHSSLFLPLSQAPLLFGIFEAADRIDRDDPCCFLDLGFPGFERLGMLDGCSRVDLSGKSELFRHRQGACDNPELSRRVTLVVCRR
jgi:hypothetical protein